MTSLPLFYRSAKSVRLEKSHDRDHIINVKLARIMTHTHTGGIGFWMWIGEPLVARSAEPEWRGLPLVFPAPYEVVEQLEGSGSPHI